MLGVVVRRERLQLRQGSGTPLHHGALFGQVNFIARNEIAPHQRFDDDRGFMNRDHLVQHLLGVLNLGQGKICLAQGFPGIDGQQDKRPGNEGERDL